MEEQTLKYAIDPGKKFRGFSLKTFGGLSICFIFVPETSKKDVDMKQFMGIQLEKKDGQKVIAAYRFQRVGPNNKAYRPEVQYRIMGNTSDNNIWLPAFDIKYKIREALGGNKTYAWILEGQTTQPHKQRGAEYRMLHKKIK